MIKENLEIQTSSNENFVEAAQLARSHRQPVGWMLATQVALLGLLLIGLASPSTGTAIAMFALLAGFLWYANSVWLTAFLMVVIGAKIIQTDGQRMFFVESALLLDCVLILLTLVASFRYIELRNYLRAFELGKSYRELKVTVDRSLAKTLLAAMEQLVRRQWYHSAIAIFAAFMLLWSIPATKQWTQKFWLDPTGGRFIFLALALFLGWFVCRAAFSMWDWFGLTPKQADVAMRSWANRELWSETACVQRRRSNLRRADFDND